MQIKTKLYATSAIMVVAMLIMGIYGSIQFI